MNDTKKTKSKIGQECIIKDNKHNEIVGGKYIDNGRRIRLLTGEHSGEVLSFGQYDVIEIIKSHAEGTLAELLGMVWAS